MREKKYSSHYVWVMMGLTSVFMLSVGVVLGALIAKRSHEFFAEERGQVIVRYEASFENTQALVDRLAVAMAKFEADFAEIEHRRGNELYGRVRFVTEVEDD